MKPETFATMLSHLSLYLCPHCEQPLGRFHAYHLHRPDQLLSQLADHAPAHLGCLEAALEETTLQNGSAITCIATVKASPTSPSGRLVRLPHPETGEPTAHIHLLTPDTLRFLHLSAHPSPIALNSGFDSGPPFLNTITRPATPEEIIAWMTPALADALSKATSGDEQRTILHQLGLIASKLPERERAAFKSHLGALPPPKLISTWAELAALPETPTHRLEIDIDGCNGWIKSKHPADADKLGTYLSTHTFYGSQYERSTHELRACGWNITIANWDASAAQ